MDGSIEGRLLRVRALKRILYYDYCFLNLFIYQKYLFKDAVDDLMQ